MVGRSPVVASQQQRDALAQLASSRDRAEADRARAILLTLDGWTSAHIGAAFGVREDVVRARRSGRGASRLTRSNRASAGEGARGAGRARGNFVGSCRRPAKLAAAAIVRDRTAHGRENLQIPAFGGAAKKRGLSYRRPRHTFKGRQYAEAMAVWGCGWPCARRRPRLATSCCCTPTRARRSPIGTVRNLVCRAIVGPLERRHQTCRPP